MKHLFLSLAVALIVLYTPSPAQEVKSTSRLQKQHTQTPFIRANLKRSEASILLSIQGQSVDAQRMAIQTLRSLEQVFPEYSFASLIEPLGTILKNQTSDPQARRLAAIALDELHSDAADFIIKGVADKCDDEGLKTLCQALLISSS